MKHKIIRVQYKTKSGNVIDGYFIKGAFGLVPFIVEKDVQRVEFPREISRDEIGEIDIEL